MLKEFKEFALKGNAWDMAVGIIIGAAFGKIVSSLVDDLIMPIFGYLLAGVDFTELAIPLGDGGTGIMYGNFIQTALDFLIISFSIFLLIRTLNRFRNKNEKEKEASEEPAGPTETQLLLEIRDLLKENKTKDVTSNG